MQWWPRPWSSVSSLLHEFKSAGRWYFPEHAKDREKPVWSVHNNWVVSWTILLFTMIVKLNDHFIQIGNQMKIARAKQFGHWFFNETSDSCIQSPTLSDSQQPKWTGPSALAPSLLKSCWAVVLLPGNFHIQKSENCPVPTNSCMQPPPPSNSKIYYIDQAHLADPRCDSLKWTDLILFGQEKKRDAASQQRLEWPFL